MAATYLDELIYKHSRSRAKIERVEVVARRETATEILEMAINSGWRCTFSSPYTNKTKWPKLDTGRSILVMERDIK
jgi:hypothetical protein